MRATVVTSTLLGLAGLGAAWPSKESSSASSKASSATSGMHHTSASSKASFTLIHPNSSSAGSSAASTLAASVSSAIEAQFTDIKPFPNVKKNSTDQFKIEDAALGQIPRGNAAPPATTKNDSIISLGFIAFNELFEVAFFTELIKNITDNVPGFDKDFGGESKDDILRVLTVVRAQEELHALNANFGFSALTGGKTIQPCEYHFGVPTFLDAIALASKFTDVVLATLPDIQTIFATQGDKGLIRGVGSVIGQEGEQNGFYHKLLNQVPSQLPFLTAGSRDLAFNAILQNFVVPGTCDPEDFYLLIKNDNNLGVGLKAINTLNVLSDPKMFQAQDIYADFSFDTGNAGLPSGAMGNEFLAQPPQMASLFYLTYLNQQNSPFSVPIKVKDADKQGVGATKFTASFPGKTNDMRGLTIAVLTESDFTGQQASADDVSDAALFGPALIEVNAPIKL